MTLRRLHVAGVEVLSARRRWLQAGLSMCCWGWAGLVSAASAETRILDRMPAFWDAWDASDGGSPDERASRLIAEFFEAEQATYRRAGMPPPDRKRVVAWLHQFEAMAPSVRLVHGRLSREFSVHTDRFLAVFRDFDTAASPVTVLPSLFAFDAHLEPDGTRLPLFIAPDGIVRYHGADADLGVLLAHEIFHGYQGQKNPALALDAKPPLFAGVWIEGCATFASERLNPQASTMHVLLDDQVLARDGMAAVPRAARVLLDRLDSTDDKELAAFLDAGHTGDWPARIGYLLGLLVARRAAQRLSLAAMASLDARAVRSEMASALAVLAAP